MEKFLKDIGIFFIWVINKIPETVGFMDTDQKVIFWLFTTGLGCLTGFGIKNFKK